MAILPRWHALGNASRHLMFKRARNVSVNIARHFAMVGKHCRSDVRAWLDYVLLGFHIDLQAKPAVAYAAPR